MKSWGAELEQRYEQFLEKLSRRSRLVMQKHDEEARDEAHTMLWKRMAGGLGQLAWHAIETGGQGLVKFYIADGRYRQQVFALQDLKGETIVVYFPDVTTEGVARKLIVSRGREGVFGVMDGSADGMKLELIEAHGGEEVPCQGMLGWGRRALKAELRAASTDKAVATVERLCELAAERWATKP